MEKLDFGPERVSPSGNITAAGVINQLGRPGLDVLEVLTRESVQNSWDARQPGARNQVHFGLTGWQLTDMQRKALRDFVFVDCPPAESLPLKLALKAPALHALIVSDRGTIGLGGPTRADLPTTTGEPRDFVDFLRNVGQPPEKKLSGGTYGYGKAALYRASTVHTILVHTRCEWKGRLESRFIASALGQPYGRGQFTGRFWWGQEKKGVVEPLLGTAADKLAAVLGFPPFEGNDCGTSILILQPVYAAAAADFNGGHVDRTPRQSLSTMAEFMLWYFWPKLIAYGRRRPTMKFTVQYEGEPVQIPAPADYPPLAGYVQAMHRIKDDEIGASIFPGTVQDIASQRPIMTLGRLALQRFPVSSHRGFDTGISDDDTSAHFASLTHHTALMRQPELVVKYLAGPLPVSGQLGYAGVFITSVDADEAYASSEPPAHDDWVPKALEDKRHKRLVNAGLREIKAAMEAFAKPATGTQPAGELAPLGAFARRLGASLLPSVAGPAAVSPFTTRRPTDHRGLGEGGPAKPMKDEQEDEYNIETPGLPLPPQPPEPMPPTVTPVRLPRARVEVVSSRPLAVGGGRRLEISFTVKHAPGSAGTKVTISPRALLDDGQVESEPPAGAVVPEVLQWVSPQGARYAGSPSTYIAAGVTGIWRVLVSIPEDVFLHVDLAAEAQV
ncbi:MAG: hypothetical protein IT318_14870 [Anaerolineales bacterium]|nr:hypothetical protein [Anaerolineales bacterium]